MPRYSFTDTVSVWFTFDPAELCKVKYASYADGFNEPLALVFASAFGWEPHSIKWVGGVKKDTFKREGEKGIDAQTLAEIIDDYLPEVEVRIEAEVQVSDNPGASDEPPSSEVYVSGEHITEVVDCPGLLQPYFLNLARLRKDFEERFEEAARSNQ